MTGAELPRSPYAPKRAVDVFDAAAKLRSWGIEPDDTVGERELADDRETGPCCAQLPDGATCRGMVRERRVGEYLEYRCDSCGQDHGAVHATKVDPQARRAGLLAKAGLPEAFASRSFDRTGENLPVLNQLRVWLESFDRSKRLEERPGSLLPAPALWGLQGRGKTLLLVKTCQRVIDECDLPVAFYSARGLLRDLQRFDNDVVRGEAWERATSVPVLALDDLGAEQTTDWRLDQLAHLIDERYQRQLPILAATNYPPGQWETVLDARTVSRLSQMTFALELRGVDRRLQPSQPQEAA